jgi:hypothetical protein
MKVLGYKLSYKCIKHSDYQDIVCDTRRELDGFLFDMRRYLTDYKIVKVLGNTSEICSI